MATILHPSAAGVKMWFTGRVPCRDVSIVDNLSTRTLLWVFVKSCKDLAADDAGSTTIIGLGSPLVIGIGFLLMGPVLMLIWRLSGHEEFFKRRREVAPPGLLEAG